MNVKWTRLQRIEHEPLCQSYYISVKIKTLIVNLFLDFSFSYAVLKVRITSSVTQGRERVFRGRIQRVLEKGFIDLKKGDTISLHSNTTCNCPQVNQLDMDYLVAGHENVRQSRLYLFSTNGVVEAWERAWVGKFRKWEKRLEARRLGRNNNRKSRKRRRKGAVHVFTLSP